MDIQDLPNILSYCAVKAPSKLRILFPPDFTLTEPVTNIFADKINLQCCRSISIPEKIQIIFFIFFYRFLPSYCRFFLCHWACQLCRVSLLQQNNYSTYLVFACGASCLLSPIARSRLIREFRWKRG